MIVAAAATTSGSPEATMTVPVHLGTTMTKHLDRYEADRRAPAHGTAPAALPQVEPAIVIRRVSGDSPVVARLAALDSERPAKRDHLVAEVGGDAVAAMPLGGGRAVSDPFRPTAAAVALLSARAAQLQPAAGAPRRLPLWLGRARTAH
jgi:hypothetical protein